jgi:DNA-binding CsgD family transcriptional regulator
MAPPGELPEKLLDLIYDAATDNELWAQVVIQIADLTGSQGGVLYGQSIAGSTVYFTHNGRLSEESDRVYKERHIQNAWSLYMMNQPVGRLVLSDEAVPLSELRKTAFFDDVLRPQGVAHNAMMSLAKKEDFGAAFNMCRTTRQGPFGEPELRLIDRLKPHLRRSMLLRFRLAGYRALQRAEYQALDQLTVGVILLDRAARIIFANAVARSLNNGTGPLQLRNAKLATFSPSHSRRLDNLVQAALRGTPTGTMSIPRPGDGQFLTILVSSVRGRDVERFAISNLPDAAAMVFIFDPANKNGIPVAWIMDAYGLTLAEAKVAVAASTNTTIAETASSLNLSPNTVKTHLRRVFAKTGINRQIELARLLTSMGLVRDQDT